MTISVYCTGEGTPGQINFKFVICIIQVCTDSVIQVTCSRVISCSEPFPLTILNVGMTLTHQTCIYKY
jgi:hypothetical protein